MDKHITFAPQFLVNQTNMIFILTKKPTHRIKYIFNLIFKDIAWNDVAFTSDLESFRNFEGIKFSYGIPIENGCYFAANPLLFDKGIDSVDVRVSTYQDIKVLFPVFDLRSQLPFDAFAAIFYMVSRYEEYLPYKRDCYGRFEAQQSIAFQEGFLEKPVVHYWARMIFEKIQQFYPEFQPDEPNYSFQPTLDIDAAYSYLGKGFIRTTGAYLRSFWNNDWAEVNERTKVLLRRRKDPFDTYDYILDLQERYKIRHKIFVLFAEYNKNDKNLPISNPRFRRIIQRMADYCDVGIHPSYTSNEQEGLLKHEIENLSMLLKQDITASRQHFLKFTFPHTFRKLIDLDITDDYTMGYSENIGFRAGICIPFHFFDVDFDMETNLKIHPFMMMDVTVKQYMNIADEQVVERIKPMIDEVKKVHGTFMTLVHNQTFATNSIWGNWREIYEQIIEYAK